MTTLHHEPVRPERPTWVEALRNTDMWASIAITAMWLAVVVDAIVGPDLVSTTPGGTTTTIPSGVAVALFAFLGTWVVAKYGFDRDRR
jgi:hypothetical protein